MRDSQPLYLCAASCLASPFHFLISTFSPLWHGFAPLRELRHSSNFKTKIAFYQNRAGHFRAFSGIKMGTMGSFSFVFSSISPLFPEKILRPLPPTGHSGNSGNLWKIAGFLLSTFSPLLSIPAPGGKRPGDKPYAKPKPLAVDSALFSLLSPFSSLLSAFPTPGGEKVL